MSDVNPPFAPPLPPLMSVERARDIARTYKGFADQMAEFGLTRQSQLAMRDSQWWLTFSLALAQTNGGDDTK